MIKGFCKYRGGKIEAMAYLMPGIGDEYLTINLNIEKGLIVAAHLNIEDNLEDALGYINGWLECNRELTLNEYNIKKAFNAFVIAIKNGEAECLSNRHYFIELKNSNH